MHEAATCQDHGWCARRRERTGGGCGTRCGSGNRSRRRKRRSAWFIDAKRANGGPQGPAIDCRYAVFPTALNYGIYVRQGRLSDKGFHNFEPLVGINHINRDFLSLRADPTRTSPGISYGSGSYHARLRHSYSSSFAGQTLGARRGQKEDAKWQLVEVVCGGCGGRKVSKTQCFMAAAR